MTRPTRIVAWLLPLALFLQSCASTPPVAAPDPQQHLIALQHADSSQVAATIRELAADGDHEHLVVIAHPASNSILVSGPADQIAQVETLIAHLDAPRAAR